MLINTLNPYETNQHLENRASQTTDDKATRRNLFLAASTARDTINTQERLVSRMRDLAEHLTMVADRIEANPTHLPNSAGIVQDQGNQIDRLCGELHIQHKALKTMMALIED